MTEGVTGPRDALKYPKVGDVWKDKFNTTWTVTGIRERSVEVRQIHANASHRREMQYDEFEKMIQSKVKMDALYWEKVAPWHPNANYDKDARQASESAPDKLPAGDRLANPVYFVGDEWAADDHTGYLVIGVDHNIQRIWFRQYVHYGEFDQHRMEFSVRECSFSAFADILASHKVHPMRLLERQEEKQPEPAPMGANRCIKVGGLTLQFVNGLLVDITDLKLEARAR